MAPIYIKSKKMSILSESYSFRVDKFRKKDGTEGKKAVLLGDENEDTFKIRDKIKSYGWQWDSYLKKWIVYLSNDESKNKWIIDNKVQPLIDYLSTVENNGDRARTPDDIRAQFNEAMAAIDTLIAAPAAPNFDPSEIKRKLEEFKQQLVSAVTSDEFKRLFEPIIKFRQAQGHKFSLHNALLVMVQDKDATLVKSRGNWGKLFNRTVKPGSPAIALYVPVGGKPLSLEEKSSITKEFLKNAGKENIEDLTPGDRERLNVALRPSQAMAFVLSPSFYDVRFTEQMADKPDVVGNRGEDIPWFTEGEYNENTERLFNALVDSIRDAGINVKFVDDLGGARGVSKSGSIEILNTPKKSSGVVSTIVHEFAHEILHQKYLKNQDSSRWADYFVGTEKGREIVEEQAEICAWIVMKSFGYNLKESINYAGIWGIDENNAVLVFDSVAKTASFIIRTMNEHLEGTVNESADSGNEITAADVARFLGMDDVYAKAKERLKFARGIHQMLERLDRIGRK